MDLYERLSTRMAVTVDDLCAGFDRLGLRRGGVVEVHAAVASLGWVVGGPGAIVLALQRHLGPDGTVLSVTGWDGTTFHLQDWPAPAQAAATASMPAYDPLTSAAEPAMGVLAERIRTWPGAIRSAHPECSMTALGRQAAWLAGTGHPDNDAFGAGSPLARLVEAGGQVLLVGAPLSSVTLVHHAEAIVAIAGKRRRDYRLPMLEGGIREWRDFHDVDTSDGAFPYDRVLPPGADYVEAIAADALAAGVGTVTDIGEARCHCFDAAAFVAHALGWLTDRFGGGPG